jgi:hypothetical protein
MGLDGRERLNGSLRFSARSVVFDVMTANLFRHDATCAMIFGDSEKSIRDGE